MPPKTSWPMLRGIAAWWRNDLVRDSIKTIAPLCLLLVTAVGLWTIQPVKQNRLLQEQIAEKELELRDTKKATSSARIELGTALRQLQEVETQAKALEASLAAERDRSQNEVELVAARARKLGEQAELERIYSSVLEEATVACVESADEQEASLPRDAVLSICVPAEFAARVASRVPSEFDREALIKRASVFVSRPNMKVGSALVAQNMPPPDSEVVSSGRIDALTLAIIAALLLLQLVRLWKPSPSCSTYRVRVIEG